MSACVCPSLGDSQEEAPKKVGTQHHLPMLTLSEGDSSNNQASEGRRVLKAAQVLRDQEAETATTDLTLGDQSVILQHPHSSVTEMASSAEPVEFSSRVPREDYDEFAGNFPLHGATSWFIRTSLKEFNKKCRDNPSLIETIREAIEQMTKDPFAV